MPRRRRNRGQAAPALFAWTHTGDIQPDTTRDNPRTRPCPACKATKGEPCTRGGRGGRIPLDGYHDSRRTPVDQEPPEDRPSGPVRATGDPNQ